MYSFLIFINQYVHSFKFTLICFDEVCSQVGT